MKELKIGNKVAKIPIIQGGMGVGVSRGKLAGAVAKEGGIGIISTAQIGYDKPGFEKNEVKCNEEALREHIRMAKKEACGGLVGVNVMTALKHYREHVKIAVEEGIDVVICGAGIPFDLPELVEGSDTKIAPIVSTARCTELILKKWDRKYKRTTDFIVIEGPKAGGHLGFTREDAISLENIDEEIQAIIGTVKKYEEKYEIDIPVIVAGGIFDKEDIRHVLSLGADGVQIASRFVATHECDASDAYKQAYINAKEEDICIINSPVGMPGRALNNPFQDKVKAGLTKVERCYQCLAKCNPAEIPYCITKALVNAVKGDLDNGLIFCGANVGRINKIVSVHELMQELVQGI
ncbi:MAG: nitronate monooxygenase [Clostridiales bacterium]|nr:nitronate monooxygenase [Clostridiales bacterium]